MKTRSQFYLLFLIAMLLPVCNKAPVWIARTDRNIASAGEDSMYLQTPEEVVALFCENFFDAAPPHFDNEAAKNAYRLLSASTQQNLNGIRAGLSGRLTMFAGVQDVPDRGFHVTGTIGTEETAWVETCWHYDSGHDDPMTSVKVFALALQEGEWKINEIQKK
jgi:hypothetical protein